MCLRQSVSWNSCSSIDKHPHKVILNLLRDGIDALSVLATPGDSDALAKLARSSHLRCALPRFSYLASPIQPNLDCVGDVGARTFDAGLGFTDLDARAA